MAVPFSTYVFGVLGAGFLVRAVWNPHRAVLHSGSVRRCPGPDSAGTCRPSLGLSAEPDSKVYSTAGGKVISVGDVWVQIQAANEPVIVDYFGVTPTVKEGDHVWRGQKIGTANGPIDFSVWEIMKANGSAQVVPVEPRSWLASRGLEIVVKGDTGSDWCGEGRHVSVPQAVHQTCGLQNPQAAGYALLPVSVTQE